MISVVIIDDETKARTTLKQLLSSVNPTIQVTGEADSVASGLQLLSRLRPDAVFLDIQMEDGTGFDLLDRLRSIDFHVVFATAFDEFAIKAFRYHALDYLLKPIDPDDLLAVCRKLEEKNEHQLSGQQLDRLLQSMQSRRIENLALSTSEGIIYLKLTEIIRLESEGNYTYFHTTAGDRVIVSRTLKEFETLLPEERFFRTHQSHIVNLREVRKMLKEDGGYALMCDDSKVPIARRKKDEFLNRLEGMSI